MPLDVAVMLSEDKTKITVAIVNPTHQVQKLNLALRSISINEDGKVYFIQSADDMVFNDPGMADKIQIQSKAVKLTGNKLYIPPVSSSIYVFDVAN
jgi:alpha-L-arabinofuranosidase